MKQQTTHDAYQHAPHGATSPNIEVTQPDRSARIGAAAFLLVLLNAQRIARGHPGQALNFTSLAVLLGSVNRVELHMPSDALGWAVVLLPPPPDVEFLPPLDSALAIGNRQISTASDHDLSSRVDRTVVIHAACRLTGHLLSVSAKLNDLTLDRLTAVAEPGDRISVETSRAVWSDLTHALPELQSLGCRESAQSGCINADTVSSLPILHGQVGRAADDPHIESWIAAGRRWLLAIAPPEPEHENKVWRTRMQWTVDAVVRSLAKAALDDQTDAFDQIEGSLFDGTVDDEDEDSGLNLRALSLLRRLATDEAEFATSAAYNWMVGESRSDHATRIQLAFDVITAPADERDDALLTAYDAFADWRRTRYDCGAEQCGGINEQPGAATTRVAVND